MSYQYPSPTTPPPPYDTGYPIPSQPAGMGMRSPGDPVKNEDDPATLHFDGKRESPDPGLATVDQAQGSDPANMGIGTDKKRGKLNYHRAGTACSKETPPPPPFPPATTRKSCARSSILTFIRSKLSEA